MNVLLSVINVIILYFLDKYMEVDLLTRYNHYDLNLVTIIYNLSNIVILYYFSSLLKVKPVNFDSLKKLTFIDLIKIIVKNIIHERQIKIIMTIIGIELTH